MAFTTETGSCDEREYPTSSLFYAGHIIAWDVCAGKPGKTRKYGTGSEGDASEIRKDYVIRLTKLPEKRNCWANKTKERERRSQCHNADSKQQDGSC